MLPVQYAGSTSRDPSPALWGEIPLPLLMRGVGGTARFDDFDQGLGGYDTLAGTGCTTDQAGDAFGAVKLTLDGTADDECSVQFNGAEYQIDTSTPGRFAYECRVKKASVADNVVGLFAGLSQAGQAATGTLVNTTGALESADFIGFHVPMGTSGATCNFVWRVSGQAMVTGMAGVHTFAADTYVRLGFLYDTYEPEPAKRLKIFKNGVLQTTYGTDTQLAAATFPDLTDLAPIFHAKMGSGASASSAHMDWWQVSQER